MKEETHTFVLIGCVILMGILFFQMYHSYWFFLLFILCAFGIYKSSKSNSCPDGIPPY